MGPQETLKPTCKPLVEPGEMGLARSIILYHGRQLQGIYDEILQYVSETKFCICSMVRRQSLLNTNMHVVVSVHYRVTVWTCDWRASPLEKHGGDGVAKKRKNYHGRTEKRSLGMLWEHNKWHDAARTLWSALSLFHRKSWRQHRRGAHFVKKVLYSSSRLFTLVDIFDWFIYAQAIMNIMSEIFGDIEQECCEDEDECCWFWKLWHCFKRTWECYTYLIDEVFWNQIW